MRKALFILNPRAFELIYGDEFQESIGRLVDVYAEPQTAESARKNPDILADAEILFTGWGAPRLDEAFLAAAPNLKMVFYGAGSIRGCTTEAFWARDIRITSAYGANAVPVSEYTMATILLSLKRVWHYSRTVREIRAFPKGHDVPGAYHATVGLVSLGMIGRQVCERLRPFDLNVLAYDPFLDRKKAIALGVEPVSLNNLFARSHVVSLHTPLLDRTRRMIRGKHLLSMKRNATLINTARGGVVHQDELIEALRERPDLTAILDVTHPEPPPPDSPLYELPNVVLTPHIAGSAGAECRRMGSYILEELRRYLNGDSLKWEITRDQAVLMA